MVNADTQASMIIHSGPPPIANDQDGPAPGLNGNGHAGGATSSNGDNAIPTLGAGTPEVADKTRMMRNVTSGAAHDLTNLLCVIGFDLDSLESERLSPGGTQALGSLRSEISYLRGLARELHMAAAEVETPNADKLTRLAAWWPDMKALILAAHREGVIVTANIPWGLPAVGICARHLTQIVLNLAGNSAHAIAERNERQYGAAHRGVTRRGEIRFSARLSMDSGRMELTVADNGAGMSAEVLRRACEPNFTTRSGLGGSGIGLGLVRRLIDDAGGSFRIASTEETGATMTFELPTRGT
jgi:signal transduction histidine kinase